MRTLAIFGTDISGKQDWWDWHYPEENPILDATHHFDRAHRPSMEHQYHDMANVAQFDALAIGCRGKEDAGFAHFPLWRDVMRAAKPRGPTLLPWCDTGAMTDYHNYHVPDGQKTPFDFAIPAHVAGYWTHVLGPYFETFTEGGNYSNPIKWERTADGRIVIAFWGISSSIGHGIRNQDNAQRLLDSIAQQMKEKGIGEPAFIIDDSWPAHIKAEFKHGWFDPGKNRPWTITEFNGKKTGVLVAGFHDPHDAPHPHRTIDRRNGATLREGLAAMRSAKADIVLYESYNNRVESAGLYPTMAWGNLYLDIVREHMLLTRTTPVEPEPITPLPHPAIPEGATMIALAEMTSTGAGPVTLYEDLIPGKVPGTHALILETEPGGRKKIYSKQADGSDGWRYLDDPDRKMPDTWESGRKLGRMLTFRTGNHVKMYWIAAEGI